MPLYELFCMAKPALQRVAAGQLMRTAATAVLNKGGILTNLKSYGDRELAYQIRRPGMKFNKVGSHLKSSIPPFAQVYILVRL